MMLEFPIMAEYCLIYTGNRTIFAIHGHHFNKTNFPQLSSGDILLHGHTHVPAWKEAEEGFYFNPGSVSIPKNNSKNSYMTVSDNIYKWKDLEGETYHTVEL